MRLTRLMVTLGAAGVLAFAGCGGDDEEPAGPPPQTETPSPAPGGGGMAGAGKETFATTCGGCHTLKDAGTSGTIGPDLDDIKPSQEEVLNAIETGPGQMPEGLLSGADAEAVAEYVSSAAGS